MITKMIHCESLSNRNVIHNCSCYGLLEYKGGWKYNLESVPYEHLMICTECGERLVVNSEELYGIVDGIKFQLRLQI